jgi:hypothetical protein
MKEECYNIQNQGLLHFMIFSSDLLEAKFFDAQNEYHYGWNF